MHECRHPWRPELSDPAPHGKLGSRVVVICLMLAPELRCFSERHLFFTAEPPQGEAIG